MSGSKERLRLWLRLLKVVRGIEHEVRDRLKADFDTTLPRFDMLSALSRHPAGLKMSQLSGVLRVSNGNVTGLADRLADEGLVRRVPVPGDRRAMILQITPQGLRAFETQAAAHEGWINGILGDLPAAEARAMAARLSAFADQKEEKEAAHAE